MIRIHYLQHSRTEGFGLIGDWARERGHTVGASLLHQGDPLPDLEAVDFLIAMGGPMNVYQYRSHPWLRDEKRWIERAIGQGKAVLGVCLGAQLIADVLGAKVYQNADLEIGWFPVRLTPEGQRCPALNNCPEEFTPLHWHGDTFDLPQEAKLLAQSDGCRHQAFAHGSKVLGLQFHLEADRALVDAFVSDEPEEIAAGRFVQKRSEIQDCDRYLPVTRRIFYQLLDTMAGA